jgi:hypothetical protein
VQVSSPGVTVAGDETAFLKALEILASPPEGFQRVIFQRPDGGDNESFVVETDAVVIDICPEADECHAR